MIIRIVKMTFQPDRVDDFLGVFNEMKAGIKNTPGCKSLNLLRDVADQNTFFTYSSWTDEASLDAYRNSDFFREVWGRAKIGFGGKPEAWSVEEVF